MSQKRSGKLNETKIFQRKKSKWTKKKKKKHVKKCSSFLAIKEMQIKTTV
jgi:hypothetical protein